MLFGRKKKNVGEGKIVVGTPDCPYSVGEAYNKLKDNLLYMNADGDTKVFQIESAMMSEGKTTVLANLAVSLGLTDKKVIVVDLDFRRPKMHRLFSASKDNGIAEYILGDIPLETIIKKSEFKNVDVITRGAEIYNSSLVLISDKFKNMIEQLKQTYDYVLLDCAPVLQVSDYIHVCKISDGIIFVVAYAKTTKNQVKEAINDLKKNGGNVLGTVFTMYDKNKEKNGAFRDKYYGYGYYSNDTEEEN